MRRVLVAQLLGLLDHEAERLVPGSRLELARLGVADLLRLYASRVGQKGKECPARERGRTGTLRRSSAFIEHQPYMLRASKVQRNTSRDRL